MLATLSEALVGNVPRASRRIMDERVTITMIKNLLRHYHKARHCFIWRDAAGVHIAQWPYGETYVGELKWGRYKGEL